jgi:hypothetical protein
VIPIMIKNENPASVNITSSKFEERINKTGKIAKRIGWIGVDFVKKTI